MHFRAAETLQPNILVFDFLMKEYRARGGTRAVTLDLENVPAKKSNVTE